MNVAIYARVSTAAQAEKGYSLKTQVEACKKKSIEMGATSIKEYVDDGYSGAYLERPALDSMRDAVSAKLHDVIIIYDIDRLSRDTMHLLLLTEELEKNAQIIYINSEYNRTPEGQLFFEIRGSFAKYERIKIQDRFNRGRRGKLKSGKPLKEYKIYGYDFIDGQYIINPQEAELVKSIYRLYLENSCGIPKLAEILYQRGILSLSGKKMDRGTIYGILTHTHYTGKYYSYRSYHKKTGTNKSVVLKRDSSEWIEMSCPIIIPQEIFNAVQRKLENNRVKKIRSCKYQSLFQGVLYCGICGRKMWVTKNIKKGKDYAYYMCGGNRLKAGTCTNLMHNAELVDKEVWKEIRRICKSESLLRKYQKQETPKDNTEEINKKLEQIKKQRTAIMNWYSNSLITIDECTERLQALKKQENTLLSRLQESTKENETDIQSIMQEVKQTDFAGKRNFVVTHIDKAFISRTKPNEDETEFHIVFK